VIKLKKIIDKNDAEIMIDIDIDIYKNQELGDDIQSLLIMLITYTKDSKERGIVHDNNNDHKY